MEYNKEVHEEYQRKNKRVLDRINIRMGQINGSDLGWFSPTKFAKILDELNTLLESAENVRTYFTENS